MLRTMIVTASTALAALFSLVPAGSQPHALATFQEQGTIERGFDVGAGGTLELDASFGSIEIATSNGDRVEVRVVREVRDRYEDDTQQVLSEHQVTISQSGDNVSVSAEVSDDARARWRDDYDNTPLRVVFEIRVPRFYNLDLETRAGNVEVTDLDGEVRAETAGGNLTFGSIDGTVWARTAGGNIELGGSSGSAEVRTSGGNIILGEVGGDVDAETSGGSIRIERAGGTVRAETAGGNITVEEVSGTIDASTSGGNVSATIVSQPAADCRLETSAGTVTVTLAAGIAIDVDASTSVGNVTSDLAVDGRVTRQSIRGAINGGGPELRLRTSAGSIRIRQS